MEETTETPLVPTVYMVDTNTFRYRAYIIGDLSSDDEKARQQHKLNAKAFFDKAFIEASNQEAIILASGETKQELTVQAYTLKKESKEYNKIVNKTILETTEVPQNLEYMLRDFSNHVRGKYAGTLVAKPRKTNYLQTADARILVHAYLNDAILVTANIKDFFLYPLFFKNTEDDVLYDISSKNYMKLLPAARTTLEADPKFIALKTEMDNLKI